MSTVSSDALVAQTKIITKLGRDTETEPVTPVTMDLTFEGEDKAWKALNHGAGSRRGRRWGGGFLSNTHEESTGELVNEYGRPIEMSPKQQNQIVGDAMGSVGKRNSRRPSGMRGYETSYNDQNPPGGGQQGFSENQVRTQLTSSVP